MTTSCRSRDHPHLTRRDSSPARDSYGHPAQPSTVGAGGQATPRPGQRVAVSGRHAPDLGRVYARLGSGSRTDPLNSAGWSVAAGALMLGTSTPTRIAPAA